MRAVLDSGSYDHHHVDSSVPADCQPHAEVHDMGMHEPCLMASMMFAVSGH